MAPRARCNEERLFFMSDDDPHPEFQFPLKIEDGESAIPAEYRPLYRKDPQDGSLQLIPSLARQIESPGLKIALKKARDDTREVERREKEKHRKTLEILGVESADEVPVKVAELRRASAGAADAVRAEVESRFKQTYSAQLSQIQAENQKLKNNLQEMLVDGEAARAIAAQKGSIRALMPHVKGQMKLVEEDGTLRPRVIDSDGHVRYGDDGRPLGIGDLVAEMRRDRDFAGMFENSGNSGTGASTGGGLGGAAGGGRLVKRYSKDDWRALMSKADKKPDEGGYPGGRQQLMRDYAAGKITVTD